MPKGVLGFGPIWGREGGRKILKSGQILRHPLRVFFLTHLQVCQPRGQGLRRPPRRQGSTPSRCFDPATPAPGWGAPILIRYLNAPVLKILRQARKGLKPGPNPAGRPSRAAGRWGEPRVKISRPPDRPSPTGRAGNIFHRFSLCQV